MRTIFLSLLANLVIQYTVSAQKINVYKFIDSIYDNRSVVQKLDGEFIFYHSDYEKDRFTSEFMFKNRKQGKNLKVVYVSGGDKSTLKINNKYYKLENYYDEKSCKIFTIKYRGFEKLCMIGSVQSASGSGVQVTLYCLFAKINNSYYLEKEFTTRFGTIKNLGDFNNDGKIDLLNMKRVDGDYHLYVSNLQGQNFGWGELKLKYLLNDEFEVISNNLRLPKLKINRTSH